MSTRREDLAAALTNVEENGGELAADFVPPSGALESVEAPETGSEPASHAVTAEPSGEGSGERVRDASGRFAPKTAQPEDATAVTAQPAAAAAPERPEVPKSWKQEFRDSWGALDPKVASYIAQREQEMSAGVEKFRTENEPALSMFGQLAPFIQDAQKQGFSAQQIAQDAHQLYATRASLYHADPNVRMQTLLQVAHSAGIPLQQMLQGQAPQQAQQMIDPGMQALYQRMQALEGSLTQREQLEQQQAQGQIESEIAAFAAHESHPHFETLRETMGQLIQAGMAQDLDSAYSKALRMNDDLWQQEQARQRQSSQQQARASADKAAKAAKANAVSTRSATPGATAATTGGAPKGRRAALEEAFSQATTSRI